MDSSTTSSEPNLSDQLDNLIQLAQTMNVPLLIALQIEQRTIIVSNTPAGTRYGILAALHRLQEAA